MADNTERVEPIRIIDHDTETTYELDFSRDSLKFMSARGFKVDEDIIALVPEKGEDFFFYAMRMHHKKLARDKTDALYKKMGGFSPKVVARLVELYNQALTSNNFLQEDGELEKNAHVTVEL